MNRVLRFFVGVGKMVGKGLGVVRDIVTDDQLKAGVELVKRAEVRFLDNAQRREWVVRQLKAVGIPEAAARIIVELALKIAKREASQLTDTIAGAV